MEKIQSKRNTMRENNENNEINEIKVKQILKKLLIPTKKYETISLKQDVKKHFPVFLKDFVLDNYNNKDFCEKYYDFVLDKYNDDKINLEDMEKLMKIMFIIKRELNL